MVSTEHLKPSAVATSALLLTIIRPQLFTVLSCVRLPTSFFFCACVLEAWLHPLHHAVMSQLFSVTTKLQACLKGCKKGGAGHFELWLSVTTP